MTSQETLAKLKGTLQCEKCGLWYGTMHGSVECNLKQERDHLQAKLDRVREWAEGNSITDRYENRPYLPTSCRDYLLSILSESEGEK